MTFIHNATGRPCEVERVVCYFIIAPRKRKREREPYRGEGNRDGEPGKQREQKSRIALCELSSIAIVTEVLFELPSVLCIVFILITFPQQCLFAPFYFQDVENGKIVQKFE